MTSTPIVRRADGGLIRCADGGLARACCGAECPWCSSGGPFNIRAKWRNVIRCTMAPAGSYWDVSNFAAYLEHGDVTLSWWGTQYHAPSGYDRCYWYWSDSEALPNGYYREGYLRMYYSPLLNIYWYFRMGWGLTSPMGMDGLLAGGTHWPVITWVSSANSGMTIDCSDSSSWADRGGSNEIDHCSGGVLGYDGECEIGLPDDSFSW